MNGGVSVRGPEPGPSQTGQSRYRLALVEHSSPLWVGRDDALVKVKPLLDRIEAVRQFLDDAADPAVEHALAKGRTVGRPLLNEDALVSLEKQLNPRLRPGRRARPRKRGTGKAADGYLGK